MPAASRMTERLEGFRSASVVGQCGEPIGVLRLRDDALVDANDGVNILASGPIEILDHIVGQVIDSEVDLFGLGLQRDGRQGRELPEQVASADLNEAVIGCGEPFAIVLRRLPLG